MSYEYEFKEYIREEILSNINHMNILDDALEELDHVYTQATKTDEYEAKAKAFDEISDYWRTKDMLKLGHFVDKAIRKYAGEYERGEPNAKK